MKQLSFKIIRTQVRIKQVILVVFVKPNIDDTAIKEDCRNASLAMPRRAKFLSVVSFIKKNSSVVKYCVIFVNVLRKGRKQTDRDGFWPLYKKETER